ncbi:MAG TPA: hypothetical protein VL944_00325 [Candidatus Acidoferrum sp.]|nr:hypothetical protein [Candidatus Acidoferrum sp.]
MQKSKPITLKLAAFKANSKEIHARVNLLPLKSMIYAFSHVMADQNVRSSMSHGLSRKRMASIARHRTTLEKMTLYLNNSSEMDPNHLYGTISSAAHSYVGLFYTMNPISRDAYIEKHSNNGISKRIKPENNLLIMPAIMASQRERRSKAYSIIVRNLHAMPLKFLYTKSKAAMRLELLQQAIGVKRAGESALTGFSASMRNIEALIEGINNGEINPQGDERAKELFINHIIDISETEGMGLSEFICDKLATSNVSFKIARRMIRK